MTGKEILDKNWTSIVQRVIKPLWKNQFEQLYSNIKCDYDDFESLAGYELTKAFNTYSADKSNVLTFATNVIKRKAMTEIRNCTCRDKRKAGYLSDSLNIPTNDEYETELIESIPDKNPVTNNEFTNLRIGYFLKNLSSQELKIIIMKLVELDDDDILEVLNINKDKYRDSIKSIESFENILYRRRF